MRESAVGMDRSAAGGAQAMAQPPAGATAPQRITQDDAARACRNLIGQSPLAVHHTDGAHSRQTFIDAGDCLRSWPAVSLARLARAALVPGKKPAAHLAPQNSVEI